MQYILLYIEEGCDPVNKLYYCDISALPNGLETFRNENAVLPFVKLIDNFDAQYQAIANDDTVFTFLTNKDAPKYKLVRVDLKEPTAWTDVLQESENGVLEAACAVNSNQLLVSYLSDVKHILQVRELKTVYCSISYALTLALCLEFLHGVKVVWFLSILQAFNLLVSCISVI